MMATLPKQSLGIMPIPEYTPFVTTITAVWFTNTVLEASTGPAEHHNNKQTLHKLHNTVLCFLDMIDL